MEKIELFFDSLANFLWGDWLLVALLGLGAYYTVMTGGIQIRCVQLLRKGLFRFSRDKSGVKDEKKCSSYQALCAAIASCVGSGNIVGVSTAILSGGPGTLIQSNTIANVAGEALHAPFLATGLIMAVVMSLIIRGGFKRLVQVAQRVVPVMAGIYVIGGLIVLLMNAGQIPAMFASIFREAFPELKKTGGIIESELREIAGMKNFLNTSYGAGIEGRLMLKMDSHLPVSGSVKACGGLYEVLKHAEDLALEAGMLKETDNYRVLTEQKFLDFFGKHTVQVGSTGNLGMSIGIMSAKLGFHVIVHMSADAKQWKKDLLRSRGVEVIEYADDYCAAVDQGRKNSDTDPMSYFVDDENSQNLFLGYSVAGERVKAQLEAQNIPVDGEHPLFVYIPCGIGGAPGGVTYGLKQIYGDNVHCFFTEPTHACCMMLGMATGLQDGVSVKDLDIDGRIDADGLAVGRPSAFVGRVMVPILSGIATIQDKKLYDLMRGLLDSEDIFIEPSSCAAFAALIRSDELGTYIARKGLSKYMGNATHIAWATGGNMVPEETRRAYLKMGIS